MPDDIRDKSQGKFELYQALMEYDFATGFSLPMTNPRYWLA